MFVHKSLLLSASALAGCVSLGALAAPGIAFAQAQTDSTSATSEVIVTGSRIPKSNFTSSAPIQIINSETAALDGLADTATLLQQQPIASGSFQVNGLLSGYVVTGGPGVETLSLRGLGAQRTLILLNGERLGPAGVRGTVGPIDLNVIPESILDHVEVLKDGASSIYGSDAVAGVVNFITKKNTDGGRLSVYGDLPQREGGGQYEINGTWGKTFDRGYIAVTADYNEQEELRLGQRDYTKCATDRVYDASTGASLDYTDPLTGKAKCWNVLTGVAETATGYGGSFQYAVPGVTYASAAQGNNIAAVFPQLAAAGWVRAGRGTAQGGADRTATEPYLNYDSPLYARSSAISPYQRWTFYATGGFDLTPKTEIYSELLLNQRKSQQHGYQQLFPVVSANNPNNPFVDVNGAAYDALPIVAFKNDQTQTVNYERGVIGLRGTLPVSLPVIHNWQWNIYSEFSNSDGSYTTDFIYNDRMNAVTGDAACDLTQITISPMTSCPNGGAGIPWFSQRVLSGAFNSEEKAFLFGNSKGTTNYQQQLVEGTIAGNLFNLPAGPVGASIGFALRHESIDDEPSYQERNGNLYNLSAATPTKGDDNIEEVFGELDVPILKGVPLIKSLNAEMSGRYTNYHSYGSNGTYKVGLDWLITPEYRLRGTIGTSFRAPSLYELYLGSQTSFLDQSSIDPCINYQNSTNTILQANCAAAGIPQEYVSSASAATISASGGKGILKAETSLAYTLSAVWTPSFADLSVAVDYFDITVSNEIQQYGAANIILGCYASPNYPSDPLCKLFTRDNDPSSPNYQGILTVNDNYINVAEEVNRGIDLNVRYTRKVGPIKFGLDSQFTWQFQDRVVLLAGSIPVNASGTTTEPAFTGEIQLRAEKDDWTVFWNIDMFGKASDTGLLAFQGTDVHYSTRYGTDAYYKQYTEFTAYHDVSVRRKLDKWVVVAGIKNLFDEPPPALSGNESFRAGYSALNAYDLIGRRFFFQIDRKF